jgi:TRAP-type C4-dicarboxylate transport system substrate-binding protein
MKQRILFISLVLVMIASLVLAGCSSGTSSAPAAPAFSVKMKYADQNPPNGWEGIHAAQPWLDQITAATKNAVTFETYYSQSLFKGTDAWTSTKNGVADAAWMFHAPNKPAASSGSCMKNILPCVINLRITMCF